MVTSRVASSSQPLPQRHAGDPVLTDEVVPMEVVRVDGRLDRLYLPVIKDDKTPVRIIVDSGTARTWLRDATKGDEWVDDEYRMQVGPDDFTVLGRRVPEFDEGDNNPPQGTVGNDYLLAGTTVLDFAHGTLSRLPKGELPAGSQTWSALPFTEDRGIILVDATIDGSLRHLVLDTGAPDSMLDHEHGRPGDQQSQDHDVHQQEFTIWSGTARLQLPGRPDATIAVDRSERFPHLEDDVAAPLGLHLDGILGLSALGDKRVVFDSAAHLIRIEP